jgi:glutamine---fructose-6-phosphate transaminase (isomerizing)
MTLHEEILEQPARLDDLIATQKEQVEAIARAIQSLDIQYVFLAARGTSDNAGRYANYLWGGRNGLPLALATPSLFTYYQQPPRLKGALVVGISQSGQSPDIVSVLAEGKRQGCRVLAITNEPDSPLAQTADYIVDIQAGEERAVAATKTYTAELMAIAMLSAAMSGSEDSWKELSRVPGWIETVLKPDSEIEGMAQRYRYMQQCAVLGRGYNYATAFEWALKLKELTYVAAEPYSPADFLHGPIAMVDRGFPVLAVVPEGKVFGSLMDLLIQLKNEQQAELVVISNAKIALDVAQSPILMPEDVPEWLTPIVGIVPAQLLAYHLTRAKGYDTERPRGIRKVTETR